MNVSCLEAFLNGLIPPDEFAERICDEIDAYRRGHAVKGTSIPVHLYGDPSTLVLTRKGVKRLCQAFVSGALSKWHLCYVCDALSMSEASFVDESVRNAVELLCPDASADHPCDAYASVVQSVMAEME